jgi:uncharacterized cupredoxin-like copper-binding protein
MRTTTRALAIVFALLLVLAACGDDDSTGTTAGASDTTMGDMGGTTMGDDMEMGDEEFDFGEPADPATATRVIEITAADDFTFTPDSVTVEAGETITFRVTNVGAIPHDFALGDADFQAEHEEEMAEMGDGMGHDEPNVFTLEPGETNEMTWHFTGSGEILYGCHETGHYAAGMKGTVTIEG